MSKDLEDFKRRRDIIALAKFLLFMFLIYSMINGVGMNRFDIEGMHTFLISFNSTIMFGILLIFLIFSIFENNLREYGTFRKPRKEVKG